MNEVWIAKTSFLPLGVAGAPPVGLVSPGPGDSQQIVLEVHGDSFHYFRGSSATGGSSKIESPWGFSVTGGRSNGSQNEDLFLKALRDF